MSTRAAAIAMVFAASTWAGAGMAQDGEPDAPPPESQPAAAPTAEAPAAPQPAAPQPAAPQPAAPQPAATEVSASESAALPPAPSAALSPEPAHDSAVAGPSPPDAGEGETDLRVLIGATAIGVGLTAVLVGSVIGIVAAAKYGELDCPDDVCPAGLQDDADDYNALRAPSGVAVYLGGVAVLVGVALLIDYARDSAPLEVTLGPSAVGIKGRF